jgi:hypothetical protein
LGTPLRACAAVSRAEQLGSLVVVMILPPRSPPFGRWQRENIAMI